MNVRWTKDRENALVSGVFSGLAKMHDMDPVLVRLLYVLCSLCTGIILGAIIYLILSWIVPDGE